VKVREVNQFNEGKNVQSIGRVREKSYVPLRKSWGVKKVKKWVSP